MRVLFLSPTRPDNTTDGGALRSAHILSALKQIAEVDVFVVDRYPTMFSDEAKELRRRVAAAVARGDYDVIVARYLGLAKWVPAHAWGRLVLDADDIIKSPPPHAGFLKRAKITVRNAIARVAVARAAHVWYVNPKDAPRLYAQGLSWLRNVVTLPKLAEVAPVPGRILMVGNLSFAPNEDGLLWFAHNVLPWLEKNTPNVELHAIGRHMPDLVGKFPDLPVVVRGFVDDIATEYAQASLVIAPINSGGGTQIKVIDALAHRRPLVTSRFSCDGYAGDFVSGQHLFACDDSVGDWVNKCSLVLQEAHTSNMLAERGYEAVKAYGSDRILEVVRETLEDVCECNESAVTA